MGWLKMLIDLLVALLNEDFPGLGEGFRYGQVGGKKEESRDDGGDTA